MPRQRETNSKRRGRVRRVEALRNRLHRRRRKNHMGIVKRVLGISRLTDAEQGRILGACLCLMEEVRLSRCLVMEVVRV